MLDGFPNRLVLEGGFEFDVSEFAVFPAPNMPPPVAGKPLDAIAGTAEDFTSWLVSLLVKPKIEPGFPTAPESEGGGPAGVVEVAREIFGLLRGVKAPDWILGAPDVLWFPNKPPCPKLVVSPNGFPV